MGDVYILFTGITIGLALFILITIIVYFATRW